MRAVFPFRATVPHQLNVSFVHKRGGLKRVIAAFTAQTIRGASAKLLVHERHEPCYCLGIALTPLAENLSNVGFLRDSHALFFE